VHTPEPQRQSGVGLTLSNGSLDQTYSGTRPSAPSGLKIGLRWDVVPVMEKVVGFLQAPLAPDAYIVVNYVVGYTRYKFWGGVKSDSRCQTFLLTLVVLFCDISSLGRHRQGRKRLFELATIYTFAFSRTLARGFKDKYQHRHILCRKYQSTPNQIKARQLQVTSAVDHIPHVPTYQVPATSTSQ